MKARSGCKYAAYHEAGHAVLCHYLGRLAWVCMLVDQDPKRPPSYGGTLETRRDRCITDYGGVVAQAKYQRKGIEAALRTARESDDIRFINKEACEESSACLGRTADDIKAGWLARAREMVRQHWPAGEALAAALLARKKLNAYQVTEIIAKVTATAGR
ncbi:hypothetical protein LCGC14_2653550 [marine sediment metagenome]|uniref:Peptidase M41 domain-containing protein n=1 Tax=marine sediment metagenome TaxID=412755 RepID=A0A0F8ZU64_9ZZZZ